MSNIKIKNPKKINDALKRFNYKFNKQRGNLIILTNDLENKIDTAFIESFRLDNLTVFRKLYYININKKNKDW